MYATIISGLFLINDSMMIAPVIYGGMYFPFTILSIWSLYMAWRTDPGAVPMGARPLTKVGSIEEQPLRSIRRCHKCNDNFKPARAHHDSVTGRCIVKFDHFCPWVGNAVGAFNHKFFCLFVGYTLCTCIVALLLVLIQYFECRKDNHYQAEWHQPENRKEAESRSLPVEQSFSCDTTHPLVIILIIVATTFAIFTSCMLCDQIEAIRSNTSKIARMKIQGGQGGTELERVSQDFNEMFGGSSPSISWHWFVPSPVTFPTGMETKVIGYDWDPTFGDEPFKEDDMVAAIQGTTTKEEQNKEEQLFTNDEEHLSSDDDDDSDNIELETVTFNTTPALSQAKKRVSSSSKNNQEVSFVEQTKNRLI